MPELLQFLDGFIKVVRNQAQQGAPIDQHIGGTAQSTSVASLSMELFGRILVGDLLMAFILCVLTTGWVFAVSWGHAFWMAF